MKNDSRPENFVFGFHLIIRDSRSTILLPVALLGIPHSIGGLSSQGILTWGNEEEEEELEIPID
jgi:hypothetical protein